MAIKRKIAPRKTKVNKRSVGGTKQTEIRKRNPLNKNKSKKIVKQNNEVSRYKKTDTKKGGAKSKTTVREKVKSPSSYSDSAKEKRKLTTKYKKAKVNKKNTTVSVSEKEKVKGRYKKDSAYKGAKYRSKSKETRKPGTGGETLRKNKTVTKRTSSTPRKKTVTYTDTSKPGALDKNYRAKTNITKKEYKKGVRAAKKANRTKKRTTKKK
jgi:hypothetical protein